MIKKETVFINGDGETSRDFCYIENCVQVNILAATTENPEAENIKAVCRDFRPGDVRHSLADISKGKKLLGYSP